MRHRVSDARFPPFCCRSSVAVSPFRLDVAVSVHRCRCRCRICLGSSASMIGWPATERNNGKIELDPISTEERLRQLFAVYGCNGTEFSYVYNFYRTTEFYNGRTAKRQRKNGNGMVETGHQIPYRFSIRPLYGWSGLRRTD